MKNLRILLADDDPDVRELVTLAAEQRGHSIETVGNGAELLERLKNGPGEFHVVVTDNDMPGGPPGKEILFRLLRHDLRFRDTPIILHSASTEGGLREFSEELGGIFCRKRGAYECLFAALDELAK